ncbi:AhpC/TSA-family protein [Burkholderiales bacterium]|nr:AhpC/TSA-family protein [Burkholderiales bacterium]
MTIKVGDQLPEGKVQEYLEVEAQGCSIGPNTFSVQDLARGKKIVIFGVPGAFTPTCSTKHVPGYLANYEALRRKGIDEIWCLAVNDAHVMGAWGREEKAAGKMRMMADGTGDYTRKLGLEHDFTSGGLGMRSKRFSMLVDDGVVKLLNIENGGKLETSDAQTMLRQIG